MKVLDLFAFFSFCFAMSLFVSDSGQATPSPTTPVTCSFVCKIVYYSIDCNDGQCEAYFTATCYPCRGTDKYNCYGTQSSGDTCQASQEVYNMAFYAGCDHCPCSVGPAPLKDMDWAEALGPNEHTGDLSTPFQAIGKTVMYCVG